MMFPESDSIQALARDQEHLSFLFCNEIFFSGKPNTFLYINLVNITVRAKDRFFFK